MKLTNIVKKKKDTQASTAPSAFSPQKEVLKNSNGTGVRSYLVNAGLDNSKIGYDAKNNTVTYNGAAILRPDRVVDGTSYAQEDALSKAVMSAYAADGRKLVSATDYAANNTGIDHLVSWRDGYVSVGGELVKPATVVNGKAMIEQSVMDSILAQYKEENDVYSPNEIYAQWNEKYNASIQKALNEVLSYKPWSYDPNQDPAYLAYRDAYQREGNRAYQNSFGAMAANTAGYANSAAYTAGGQQLNYYMDQLNDRIPQLMQEDYARYQSNYQMRLNALQSVLDVSDSDFEKMMGANSQTLQNISAADTASYNRDIANADRNLEREKWTYEAYQKGIDNELYRDIQTAKRNDALYQNAYNRGYYTPEEAAALGISPDENGNYPSPNAAKNQYEREEWESTGKEQLEYESYLDQILAAYKAQMSLENSKELALYRQMIK